MTKYIIKDFELDQVITHVYSMGKLSSKEMAEQWARELIKRIKAREVPEWATHFASKQEWNQEEIPK